MADVLIDYSVHCRVLCIYQVVMPGDASRSTLSPIGLEVEQYTTSRVRAIYDNQSPECRVSLEATLLQLLHRDSLAF